MPLFLETQMEKTPSCFIIDSDEETDTESNLNNDKNGVGSIIKDLYEIFSEDESIDGVNGVATTGSPKSNGNSNRDDNLALDRLVHLQDEVGQSSKEPVIDDFEFDFQTIDEAEQTEHILKVRVHAKFCMRCGIGFVQQKKLNIHLEKNECSANDCSSEAPLTCSICGRGFFGVNCLRQHAMLHAQTKPFKCKKCLRSFVTLRNLYSHHRTHKGYRSFICDLCPTTFISAKTLASHKRIHSGERPYLCRLCPKRFNRSRNLAAHKRKHASKKPFKCKFCRRSYGQNSIRNLHMRTHTNIKSGQRNFLCEVCGLTHVRFKSPWIKRIPTLERRKSDDSDSLICLGEFSTETGKRKNRRRKSSDSSDVSVQIIEDPLQITIDLVDE